MMNSLVDIALRNELHLENTKDFETWMKHKPHACNKMRVSIDEWRETRSGWNNGRYCNVVPTSWSVVVDGHTQCAHQPHTRRTSDISSHVEWFTSAPSVLLAHLHRQQHSTQHPSIQASHPQYHAMWRVTQNVWSTMAASEKLKSAYFHYNIESVYVRANWKDATQHANIFDVQWEHP